MKNWPRMEKKRSPPPNDGEDMSQIFFPQDMTEKGKQDASWQSWSTIIRAIKAVKVLSQINVSVASSVRQRA